VCLSVESNFTVNGKTANQYELSLKKILLKSQQQFFPAAKKFIKHEIKVANMLLAHLVIKFHVHCDSSYVIE